MKKWIALLLCLVLPAAALADTYTFSNQGATCSIPEKKYTVVTPNNVAQQTAWLEKHETTAEAVKDDFAKRGVLLQAWGIDGDVICTAKDDNRNCILTMHLFESENGCCYSIFGSGSNQAHEMRHLNCENAWKFFSQFKRLKDGTLVGGNMQDIIALYQK